MPKIRFQEGEIKGNDHIQKAVAISIRYHKMFGNSQANGHGERYSKVYMTWFPLVRIPDETREGTCTVCSYLEF